MSYLRQNILVTVDKERIAPLDFDWKNPYSASNLAKAVRQKNLSLVKQLIKRGSALDAPDNRGWTPLHEAATSNDVADIARVLIRAGAYIEHKTVDGESPLLIACKQGAEEIVKILIDAGSMVNTRNNEFLTPLHIACRRRNENVIRLLMSEGADLDAKDDDKQTPLYFALEKVNTVALKIMIEAGANLRTTDFFFRTPLQYSCMVGNLEIFNILLDSLGRKKSVINQQTPEGWTLLMEASQYKSYLIAEQLIEHGADTTLVENRNLLAIHIAAHCQRQNLFELLLTHTPKPVIEEYSVFGKNMIHYRSLPCLLIDRNSFEGLELLFQSGFSNDVLKCPVQMGCQILSPISFLLLYANEVDDESRLKILEYLLEYDFLLDPEYNLQECQDGTSHKEIVVISPIEAALMVHREHHRPCNCIKFISMILEKGVSPDNLRGKDKLYIFQKAVELNFLEALDILFKYSDRTEPDDVLDMFVISAMNNERKCSPGSETELIQYLVDKNTHEETDRHVWFVSMMLESEALSNIVIRRLKPIRDILEDSATSISSLKKLSRSAIRTDIHQKTTPPSDYTFREYIRNIDLPYYITRYLLYEVDF